MARFGVSPWATTNLTPTSQYKSILDPNYKGPGPVKRFLDPDMFKDRLPRGAGKMGNYLAEQRKLQNKIAEEQLRMMKQQRRQGSAREFERKDAAARGRYNAQFDPQQQMAREALNKMREEASNRAAVIAGTGPNALGMPGARKARRVSARGMFTGGNTGRASISPYGDPGISATPRNEGAELIRAQMEASPYSYAQGNPKGKPSWMNLPSKEKGGTVPKTGPYELHKGEIVVSADQVDQPLLHALKTDKLSKMHTGQMDGKGTGPGRSLEAGSYRGGTMGGYQDGTLESILRYFYDPGVEFERNPIQGMSPAIAASRTGGRETAGELQSILEALATEPEMAGPSAAPIFPGAPENVPETEPPQVTELMAQAPAGPPQVPPSTFERAQEGDFGTPEDPLTLQGDPRAQPVSTQMSRDADRASVMATLNRTKAERIEDYLANNAGQIDPDLHKELSGQAKQLNQAVQLHEQRIEDRRTVETTVLQKAQQSVNRYDAEVEKARIRAESTGKKEEKRQRFDLYRDMRGSYEDMANKFLEGKYEDPEDAIEMMSELLERQIDYQMSPGEDRPSTELVRLIVQRQLNIIDDEELELARAELEE